MKKMFALLAICSSLFFLTSCKSGEKDADVKASVESALRANPDLSNLNVDVKDGVVTVAGEVKDETTKASIEGLLKDVKGAKTIVNNTSIAPPPAPVAPVAISTDDSLSNAVRDAVKDHPSVLATVNGGVITLTGEIPRKDLSVLMQKLNALKPKKIESKELVKK